MRERSLPWWTAHGNRCPLCNTSIVLAVPLCRNGWRKSPWGLRSENIPAHELLSRAADNPSLGKTDNDETLPYSAILFNELWQLGTQIVRTGGGAKCKSLPGHNQNDSLRAQVNKGGPRDARHVITAIGSESGVHAR